MKKKLIILLLFSFSISGTMYLAYDTDDAEIITLGYNHMYKQRTSVYRPLIDTLVSFTLLSTLSFVL